MTDDHPLKVTSPRLEQDEFEWTPSGRPDRPPASRVTVPTTRARGDWDDPTPAVETTDTTLGEYGWANSGTTDSERKEDENGN